MRDAVEITKKLISFPSITPNDAGVLDYIKNLLESYGFCTYIKEFGNASHSVRNLYAEHGSKGPNLCFAGHVDVVDPVDKSLWSTPPFEPYEKDGLLYGRGATDMKGAIGSAISAAISFVHKYRDHPGKISFLLTADEEVGSYEGTQSMLSWMQSEGFKIDFAIVGEPTCEEKFGDTIKIGRRGSINFMLVINGIAGHVAYPDKAYNPIPIAAKIISALDDLVIDNGNEHFDKSNLEVTNIDIGNKTTNVIPAKVKIDFNVRFNNENSLTNLVRLIQNSISQIHQNFQLTYDNSSSPFLVNKIRFHDDFAEIVQKHSGIRPQFATNGGTSDARFIRNHANLLEFGVRNSSAHKINEFVDINDLQILKNVYYDAMLSFFALS